MGELRYAEVCCQTRLSSLFAYYTYTHVCSLDHADIVAAIADTSYAFLRVRTDQMCEIGFLRWRAAAGNYSGQADSCGDECFAVMMEKESETLSVNKQRSIRPAVQGAERIQCRLLPPQIRDGVNVLASAHKLRRDGYAPRRLDFVTREHPDLDTRVPE
jgi:hypothetical protein